MVKNVVLQELSQCQHCWISRAELPKGAHLSKCAGCQVATYCSKECQRAAWPEHKPHCQDNSERRARIADMDQNSHLKRLQGFSWKHRPSVSKFGIHAFGLNVDVTRCTRQALFIRVTPNPKWDHGDAKKRIETAFIAKEISVVPLEHFGKVGEEMRAQLRAFHEGQRRVGYEGAFMAVFCDVSTGITNTYAAGFAKEMLDELEVGRVWKQPLLYALNSGTVL